VNKVGGLPRGFCVGRRGQPFGVGQVLGQPAAALRLRLRVAADLLHVRQHRGLPGQQGKRHR
jgi:hypothetical protein